MNKKLTTMVLTGALTAGLLASAPAMAKPTMVKCFGVNAVSKNDCASKGAKHSCAGQAKLANDKESFVVMPKKYCNKLNHTSMVKVKKK